MEELWMNVPYDNLWLLLYIIKGNANFRSQGKINLVRLSCEVNRKRVRILLLPVARGGAQKQDALESKLKSSLLKVQSNTVIGINRQGMLQTTISHHISLASCKL